MIDDELYNELQDYFNTYIQFDRAIKVIRTALINLNLKKMPGQASHILRHSFASHFIMNGGNILSLQKILGIPLLV